MKFLYAVQNETELLEYRQFAESIRPRLKEYIDFLRREYLVTDLPRAILWASCETATGLISDIPIPAYTNEYRVVMTPDVEAWRKIYLKQLDGLDDVQDIISYYLHKLTITHIMQILGHELAHHSQWFLNCFEEDSEDSIWFEEGMAEFISRNFFLTSAQFEEAAEINQTLVDRLQNRYGNHSLELFGRETYSGDYASIFYEYWRSFFAVKKIVEAHGGDVKSVFSSYHEWHNANSGKTLSEWFGD